MELIVTEKETAARNIAEIMSGESADLERENGVNVYRWGGTRCVGLSGHVVEVDFPPEYGNWRDVEPVELIDADVVKTPSRENIVRTLRLLARDADRVIIATDYDREGELIGKEAYELLREVTDAPVERVRFSSFADAEVRDAFADPEELDFDLAAAGEARQEVDLVWGAALTRFLSLASGQLGNDFISVGRVQSPTLKLIVDREREIEAFEPEDYWELFADLEKGSDGFETQYFYDDDGTEAERLTDQGAAEDAAVALRDANEAEIEEVRRRTRTDDPPAPFNTTQFIRAASSLGYSAGRAMGLAEGLYTAGYVTYPRTDNTVYPEDLDIEELLEELSAHHELGDDAEALLASEDGLEPTEGEEETTDHPPIHPTGELPSASALDEDEWAVYELVVRRFFATLADPAKWAHLRITAAVGEHQLKANGKRLLEAGYHAYYPYSNAGETHLPDLDEGESLSITDVRLDAKQTQPPRRRGQSTLIELMEGMGIGTKATRHGTIEKLYDRGYVENDPPEPTALATGVVEAGERFADRIVGEEMTGQLEADMDAIANGDATLAEVTDESREMLEAVFEALRESREAVGDHLRESLKADKRLGPCPECGSSLLVRESHHGSAFVGCEAYPECEHTLPLPNRGNPIVLDETCDEHDLRSVKLLDGRNTFVHGCPQCAVEQADAEDDRIIGACPECGEEEGGELAIKSLRTGSRLVGCTRYPDCEYSLPLPRRGDIEITETYCTEHDLPELVVHDGAEDTDGDDGGEEGSDGGDDDPWELGCPICNYEEYRARQAPSGLADLDGIGEKTAEKLAAAGIRELADLRDAEATTVAADVQGVSEDRLRKWQAAAD